MTSGSWPRSAGDSGLPAEAVAGRRVEWIIDAAAAGEPGDA